MGTSVSKSWQAHDVIHDGEFFLSTSWPTHSTGVAVIVIKYLEYHLTDVIDLCDCGDSRVSVVVLEGHGILQLYPEKNIQNILPH